MELRRIIRADIAASALAHLTLVALIILISEVHPFHAAPTETVTVDIITPEQLKEEEAKEQPKDKPPEPSVDLKLPKPDIPDNKEAAAQPAPAPAPSPMPKAQKQQKQPPPAQKQREADAQPQAQATPAQQPPPQPAAPAYTPPQPDVTVKYGVLLGLPPEVPLAPKDVPKDVPKHASKDDGGAAGDSIAAKLPPEIVAEFRRQLRSCSKMPAGVVPTDQVHIRLRAVMATDGTLAREPILVEATASPAKGLAMLQSAKSALLACQPYKMLPANKYREWQVLDLSFTPLDFPAL